MQIRSFCFAFLAIALVFGASAGSQSRGDTFALTNARIVTVSGATIEKGTVVVRDGLIESVGADVRVPADARAIDASGLTVYPGFIDSLSSLGLQAPQPRPAGPGGGGGLVTATPAPASASNYPVGLQPEKAVVDDLRGGDQQFEAARAAGFTTALTVGREGVFNGQSAIINLSGDTVSAMIVKSPAAMHFSFRTVSGSYPSSLMGTFSAFRQMLNDARRQQELERAYESNPKGMKRPEADRSLTALYPVVNGKMPIVFNANTEIEIIRALDLTREYKLNAIIAGGQEAWKVADRLKAQSVPVLLSVNFPKRTTGASPDADPESLEVLRFRAEAPKGAAVLAQKGVRFAFQSGGAANAGDFLAGAAKTAENGLSKEAAVRAMTLSAAEIFGLGDRLGSIEAGKIANLTVTRGDIFGKDRAVTHVVVDGKLFEQRPRPQTPAANTSGTNPAALAQVAGNWRITIEIPGESVGGQLSLAQQGSSVTGTIQTDATGTAPIKDGRATADGMSFVASVAFGGATFDINVSAKVSGNQVTGTIESPQGAIPFTGSRVP